MVQLTGELIGANNKVAKSLASLNDIVAFIGAATEAVKLAAALALLAAAA